MVRGIDPARDLAKAKGCFAVRRPQWKGPRDESAERRGAEVGKKGSSGGYRWRRVVGQLWAPADYVVGATSDIRHRCAGDRQFIGITR